MADSKKRANNGTCQGNNLDNPLVRLNASRTPAERSAAASKAGLASAAARRERGNLVQMLTRVAEEEPEKLFDVLMRILQDDSRPTLQLKAMEIIAKIAGLMDTRITVQQDKPLVTMDLTQLSTAELERLRCQTVIDSDQ